jgi:hypothetical protein
MNDDCDAPDFYSEYFRTARKEHKCCECEVPILPGDRYVACAGKWDGAVDEFKQHLPCYHIARFVNLELFAHWPERHERETWNGTGWNEEPAKDDKVNAFIWHPLDCSLFFGNGRFELSIPERKQRNACIPFGCIHEVIDDVRRFEPENCVDVRAYWDRWVHDIHETFRDGDGI